ncbi:MAG TPA: type 1 glutamine amidotransferase [Prolixibacteraceae bacterium]|nr:type 1 glutamine amidotransferase [Prolixibacteraceae bacterium]
MPGAILNWATEKGCETEFALLYANEKPFDWEEFDALIIMGGPMNIYEEDRFPWLKPEKEFIRKSIKNGKKVLGICLGSQLIADVLGSKVFRNKSVEIGWFPVYPTNEGFCSSLFEGFDLSVPVLHWHGDTYNVPDGAVHLLQSEACPSQAYSYGDQVLALQFHFEATSESLETMIELDRSSLEKSDWVMTEKELLEGKSNIPANNQMLYCLLDRFFNLC